MRTIYKYDVPVNGGPFSKSFSANAKILKVDMQFGQPFMWVLLDPEKDNPISPRYFIVYGTGHPIKKENLKYIDTFLQNEGQFVWHLFEIL